MRSSGLVRNFSYQENARFQWDSIKQPCFLNGFLEVREIDFGAFFEKGLINFHSNDKNSQTLF